MLTANQSVILIVDDQPTNLKMLFSFLQDSGFKVLVAKSGKSALDKLKNILPDLILLDVMMPGIDGFETCQRLKESPETKDIPVIFITALSESIDKVQGLRFGAIDYITKPFQQEEVLARIENQLKLRKLQKQFEEQNKQLQQEINERREIEERLQLVIQAANDGFWDWNLESGDLYISPRCKEMLGYSDQELPNDFSSWEKLVFPEDRIATLKLAEDYNAGKVSRFESKQRLRHKNGSIVHILSKAIHLKDGDGKVSRMIGSHADITKITNTLEALRESEARFRGIFENAAIGIGLTLADGTLIAVNPTYEAFLGYSQAEIQTLNWAQITHPDDLATDIALTQEVIDGLRDSFQMEKRYIRKDGQIFWGYLTVSAVRNQAGEFQFTVAMIEDINDSKLREIALRDRERRFRAIFNNSFQFTSLLQPDGTLIEANETALNFAGIKQVDVAFRPFWETPWWTISPEIQNQLKEAIAAASRGEFVRYEVDIRGAGDRVATIDFSIKPVFDETGKVVLLIPEGRDITERKKAEERLRLLDSVAVNTNDAVMITEAEPLALPGPKIVYVNESFTRITGYSKEEVIGKTPRFLQGPKTDRNQLKKIRKELKNWQSVRVEVINYRKDGSEIWVEFEIVPVANETGLYTHWVSVQRDITERKQIEEELRKSEERWQLVIKGNNDGIWDLNLTTNQVFRSARYEQILGYQEGELGFDNEDWAQRIHPDDFERVIKANQDYLERKIPIYAAEYRQRCQDGSYKWVLSRAQAIWDETGTPVRMVGSTADISDRKQMEEALYKSEERFHLALTNSELGLWDWNIGTGEVYLDPQWKKMLGYEVEEIENSFSSWEQLIHPEDLPLAFAAINAHFENITPIYEVEFRMLSKSGEWKWILSRGKLTERDKFGKPWRMTGTHKDISDRKQATLEIAAAKEALERQINRVLLSERLTQEIRSSLQSEQIFQTAATQIGEAFNVDRSLIHIYIDSPYPQIPIVGEYKQAALESMWGIEIPVSGNLHAELLLSQDRAIASDNVYTDPLLEAMSFLCQQLGLKSMLVVRTSYQEKVNGAICLQQYDRFRHWTEDEIEVIESLGAQLGIAIAQANLLEQEKQQRRELATQNHALEKAKLDAEAANSAKTLFLSKMSHELRTPLNAILGFSQIMVRDESLTRNQLEYLNIINRSGQHLLDLINDILSMAKIEAGQVSLNESRFDLNGLLESLEAMLRMKAISKGLYLTFEKAENLPQYIQTDESKLRQVLINLLGNAIKFTQKGSVILRARGGSLARTVDPLIQDPNSQCLIPIAQSLITFEIEDTGPGISPEEIGTLFEPFVQTETGRKSMEGTGLGLPISQQFVRLMGGDISVSSTLSRGTIFTFDIQVGNATTADEKPQSSQSRVIGLEPDQPSCRILLVEDVLENRLLLLKLLENLGFEVREAINGQEGVAIWESWAPHLIFMDILMPIMNGYEATKQIKQTPKGQDTVIIALTASAFEEQREAILQAGCDDFIPKPFSEEELLEKIADYLGVRYLYEDRQAGDSTQSSVLVEQLTKESLKVMPEVWVTELHQCSLYADDELIHQLIDQIPLEYESLRRALKELLDNFRLDTLIELSEPEES